MGIKHFYIWFQKQFSDCIEKDAKKIKDTQINNLCIDMNGIIHTSAQKIYEYGNVKRLIKKPSKNTLQKQINCFKHICEDIERIRQIVQPNKRIILCIDGVAGVAKLAQQRQRRFKSAKESQDNPIDQFNSNCISAGTPFMNFLSKYIDWFVRMMISTNIYWKDLEIVFSSEKIKGEGEHKIINFIRQHGLDCESFCIHGMDADLIMLTLSLDKNNIFIFRDNVFYNQTHLINITLFKEQLLKIIKPKEEEGDEDKIKNFRRPRAITDFVLMCFLVGNDFLPTLPGLAILEGGIDIMLDIYKEVVKTKGHITKNTRKIGNMLHLENFTHFLKALASFEKQILEEKANKMDEFIEDNLVKKHIQYQEGKAVINIKGYKEEYYDKKLQGNNNIKQNCHEYIDGINWIINYYKKGIPSWTWYYPNFYGPFISDLSEHIEDYVYNLKEDHTSLNNIEQLMCVLPKSSHHFLPKPLSNILYNTFPEYYPDDFIIDYSGKRKEWEGIVLIPMVDIKTIQLFFEKYKQQLDQKSLALIQNQNDVVYKYTSKHYTFNSFYGNIQTCCANKIKLYS